MNVHIAPANLAAVGLELDGTLWERPILDPTVGEFLFFWRCCIRGPRCGRFSPSDVAGLLICEVIFQHAVVHYGDAIEDDGHSLSDHPDFKRVPFAKRLVHLAARILTRRAFAVVPKSARALVLTEPARVAVGRIPNLHLRNPTQINAAIALRKRLVFEQ